MLEQYNILQAVINTPQHTPRKWGHIETESINSQTLNDSIDFMHEQEKQGLDGCDVLHAQLCSACHCSVTGKRHVISTFKSCCTPSSACSTIVIGLTVAEGRAHRVMMAPLEGLESIRELLMLPMLLLSYIVRMFVYVHVCVWVCGCVCVTLLAV